MFYITQDTLDDKTHLYIFSVQTVILINAGNFNMYNIFELKHCSK